MKINRSVIIIAMFAALLIMLPAAFAIDNETVLNGEIENATIPLSVSQEDVLTASNDYYFNASAENDGDGSADSPFKFLTAERIKANANLYFADGEYELDKPKTIEKVNIYGSDVEKTIISYSGIGFRVNSYLNVCNVTFSGMSITNYANFTAKNSVFSCGYGSSSDSYGNNFGGAIYTSEDYSNAYVHVENCTFNDNFAIYGGAIYMGAGSLEVSDCIFSDNMAYNYGGAIACENTRSVSISKSKFYNSKSLSDAGGAVYVRSTSLSLKNSDFVNSSATFGAAITSLKTELTLNNIICENNSANWDGGAIYHMYGDVSLTGSKFINNTARNGGALFVDNSTSLFLKQNTFTNNQALNCAGAIYSILNTLKIPFNAYNYFTDNDAFYINDVFDTSTIDLTIGNGNYTMYKSIPTEITVLPSYFNLYKEGYTTPVKDQETSGNCWAFTAIAVLESCILKASGQNLDLSEENMKNVMALFSDYGWTIDTNEGGYDYMPWGYLTSWLGPVSEIDDLFDDKSMLSPILNSIAHVQNILFLKRDNYTDNDAIKKALMQYGAVGTGMAYYSNYYDSSTNAYYCYSNVASNHAVTIVGWDDNYSKNNFKWGSSIQGDGAWIVRNSWSPSWGDNGYFYVSYYDTKLAQPGIYDASYTIILNDTIKYDKNYQYDISGESDFFLNQSSSIWYKNIFQATDDEYLAAVSTYFKEVTNWTVFIYVNGELLLVNEGSSNPGYYTIELDELIPLKMGDVFEVVFNVMVDGEAGFPISEATNFNKILYKPGISFTSVDGENWQDLYDLSWKYSTHWYASQVACIKAFTFLNEIATDLNLTISYDYTNPGNITAYILDEYGNPLKRGIVTFNVNEVNYNVDVIDGFAKLSYYFTNVLNNVYATFNGNGYVSSGQYAEYTIEKSRIDVDLNVEKSLRDVVCEFEAKDKINTEAIVFINNVRYDIKFDGGKYRLNLSGLENGIYNVTLNMIFPFDSIYENESLNYTFNVDVKNTQIIANDLTINDEDSVDYNITLLDEDGNALTNKTIEFILNGNVYNSTTDSNGQAVMPLSIDSGRYVLNITFKGDDVCFNSTKSTNIMVKTHLGIDMEYSRFANNVTLIVNLSKNVTDNLTVTINNRTEIIRAFEGKAYLNLSDLENNVYEVTAGLDPEYYDFEIAQSIFVVDVKNTQIVAGDIVVNDEEDISYIVKLLDEDGNVLANKTIEFTLAGKTYSEITDENGEISLQLKFNAGNYESQIRFMGDNDYLKTSASSNIKVKTKMNIALNIDKYANEVLLTVNLSKKANGFLNVSVNNESNSVRFVNGVGRLRLTDLENGNYDVEISLDDSVYDFDEFKSQFIIDVKNTMILADDLLAVEGSPVDYNISLVDENGNAVSNKSVSFIIDGKTYFANTDVNGQAIISINLTPGQYSLDISFNGDDTYLKSAVKKAVKVKTKVDLDLSVVKFANNVSLMINLSKNINDTLTVSINNASEEIEIINGSAKLELFNLENGIYGIECYLNDDDYEFERSSASFAVDVKSVEFIGDNFTCFDDSSSVYIIQLADLDGNPVSNQTVKISLGNNSYYDLSDDKGYVQIPISLNRGNYTLNAEFEGSDNYFKSSKSFNILVKTKLNIDLTINQIVNDVTIQIDLSKTFNGTIGLVLNNKTETINLNGNSTTLKLDSLENGIYHVSCFILDETFYEADEAYKNFTIDLIHADFIADDFTCLENTSNDYVIQLVDENNNPLANQSVKIILEGMDENYVSDDGGKIYIPINLKGGIYSLTAIFEGSNKYYNTSKSFNITVKSKISFNLEITSKWDMLHMEIFSSDVINENVTVTVNEREYTVYVNNLRNYLDIFNLSNGKYDVKLELRDSELYFCDNVTKEFIINVSATKIISNDFVTYANSCAEYQIILLDENDIPLKNSEIIFTLNGNEYLRQTNDEGMASIVVNLTDGQYLINISYAGLDEGYFACSSENTIRVITSTISDDSVIRTSGYYSVKLVDVDGLPLKNAQVSYSINGVNFTSLSDENGFVNIEISKEPGNYILNIINPINGQVMCENITVYPKITNNKDMVIYAFSGTKFKVLVLDDNGNPVGSGNIVVMKISGKSYEVKTDKNGYASLAIKLKSGKYTITSSFGGYKVSNKITVKPVLTAKNISKKKAKSYKFKAKLVNAKGKPLKGKKITFKIKGKKYTAKTNKKGVATVTIKLKLKVGSYKIYSIYGKSKIKNTIKIKK